MTKHERRNTLWRVASYLTIFLITFVLLYVPFLFFRADITAVLGGDGTYCRAPKMPFTCIGPTMSDHQVEIQIITDTIDPIHLADINYLKNPHNCRPTKELQEQLESGLIIRYFMDHQTPTIIRFDCDAKKVSVLDFELLLNQSGYSYGYAVYTSKTIMEIVLPWLLIIIAVVASLSASLIVVEKRSHLLFVITMILYFVLSLTLKPVGRAYAHSRVLLWTGLESANFVLAGIFFVLFPLLAFILRKRNTLFWVCSILLYLFMIVWVFFFLFSSWT